MGFSTLFKYLTLAMEAAEEASKVIVQVNEVKDPNSPGGTEITAEETKALIENLDENFSRIVTRICYEARLPVKSVKIEIEMQ